MKDLFGRRIDYVRISVTDRCNLRCLYCMPPEGVESVSHDDILTFEQIEFICRAFAGMGISKIKITGGEPLVRKNLPVLIEKIKSVEGIEQVTLTTNGVLLEKNIAALEAAGVDGINISLDAADSASYKQITGADAFDTVIGSIKRTLTGSIPCVKVNCVAIRGVNGDALDKIAALAMDYSLHVRFIELMPMGCGARFTGIPMPEIRSTLESRYGPLLPCPAPLGSGPAEYYQIDGFKGKIGFISPLSNRFCAQCNRLRLSSTGFLKTCLHHNKAVCVKDLLNPPVSLEELSEAITGAIRLKPERHSFVTGMESDTCMVSIGG